MTFPCLLQRCPNHLPLFNLVQCSMIHSLSAVGLIKDPRYGNLSTCSSCSFWMSMRHTMPSLTIIFVCQRWWVRCIYDWIIRSNPPAPVVLPPKWPTGLYYIVLKKEIHTLGSKRKLHTYTDAKCQSFRQTIFSVSQCNTSSAAKGPDFGRTSTHFVFLDSGWHMQ